MAYEIPNFQIAPVSQQSRPDKRDFDVLLAPHQSESFVISGLGVTPSSALTVAVASGRYSINGVEYSYGGGTATAVANATGNPRIDLVVINTSGVVSVVQGTPVAVTSEDGPQWPAIPANSLVLARLDVTAGLPAITTDEIVDKRVSAIPRYPGYKVYRIFEGMSASVSSVWQGFWNDTGAALLLVGPKSGSGASVFHNLSGASASCTGAAAEAPKVIRGAKTLESRIYSNTGTFLYEGPTGSGADNVIDIDGFSIEMPQGEFKFRNINYGKINNTMIRYTPLVVSTYNSAGQAEFNEFWGLEFPNAPNRAIQFIDENGWNSMRGTRMWASVSTDPSPTVTGGLTEDLTNAETGVDVTNGANYKIGMIIEIDTEKMRITNIVGNTLTVTRGYGGTTPATHLSGANIKKLNINVFYCENSVYHSIIHIHSNGGGMVGGGAPSGNPTADGYTGHAATFWLNDTEMHGAHVKLYSETGAANHAVGLWYTDVDSNYRQWFGELEYHSIWEKEYMAVTDMIPDHLPRYKFGLGQQPMPTAVWTAADGSWSTDHFSNMGGSALLLE